MDWKETYLLVMISREILKDCIDINRLWDTLWSGSPAIFSMLDEYLADFVVTQVP